MQDFDVNSFANKIKGDNDGIYANNLKEWAKEEGKDFDFQYILYFMKETVPSSISISYGMAISKEQLCKFLNPYYENKENDKIKDKSPVLNRNQKFIRSQLHRMQLLNLFRHIS